MIDRPVALVCTGYGQHPVRELVVLVPVARRADIAAIMQAQGLDVGEPSSDVERGFGIETSMVTEDSTGRRVRRKADARLVNTPGVGWQVVAPGCPTCGGVLVESVTVVAAHVAAHFPQDGRRVDVDIRPE